MLRKVTAWSLLAIGLAGCTPTPPAEVPSSEPANEFSAVMPENAEPAATTTTPAPDRPEFVTASQMRERLGVGDAAHFERVGRGFVAAHLADTGVKDLTPLIDQPLQMLNIAKNPVSSLEGLEKMPLMILDLSETKVTSLAPLTNCSSLTQLFFESTPIDDLTPLKGKKVTHLYAINCPVTDLSPLAGMHLQQLNLCGTKITSLEPLKDVQADILWIRDTEVSDVSPLKDMSLTSLDLEGTKVSDLSPLATMTSLQRLNIADTPVTDLTPLANLPLSRLIFSPERITGGVDLIRKMPTLQEIDTQYEGEQPQTLTASEFWERYDAGQFKSEIEKSR